MPIELEAAVADGLSDRGPGRHAPPPGATCANCGAILHGPFCHACGQNADHHKRSILHLTWEMIEDLFHLDGRLSRTLPDLFFRPGRLARDYMEGRLARHVPPFRTFLVTLLLFMFAAEHALHEVTLANERQKEARVAALATPRGRAAEAVKARTEADTDLAEALAEAVKDRADDLKDANADKAAVEATYAKAVAEAQTDHAEALKRADLLAQGVNPEAQVRMNLKLSESRRHKSGSWEAGLKKAVANPEYFLAVLFGWGHRLAVLLLPIVGFSLALVYRNKPRFFIHDHMLVAMDLLSFAFLTNAVGFVLPPMFMGWWLLAAALWLPLNLFQTLRGAYGSGIFGALVKTLVVWMVTVFAFLSLLIALMVFVLGQL